MADLTRYTQKLFGTSAGANEMAEYGSLIGSPPGNLYSGSTITPAIVQQLSQFQGGLYAAVSGAYSPTIQDMNSLFFLLNYQLAYILQKGIAAWDSGTTYYINDFVKVGSTLYVSLQNTNLNQAPASSPSYWGNPFPAPTQQIFTSGSGAYTLPTTPKPPIYLKIRITGGAGGGGGSGTGSAGSNGSAGGDSIWSLGLTNLIIAGGGAGSVGIQGGIGGSISHSGPTVIFESNGGAGDCGATYASGATGSLFVKGGTGGQNSLGGAGVTRSGSNGLPGQTNSGGGGAGGSILIGAPDTGASGGGGGAGAYGEYIIYNPSSAYNYIVGSTGNNGTAGSGGEDGGFGAAGIIIVEEYYQ